jgi:hypothetical protein
MPGQHNVVQNLIVPEEKIRALPLGYLACRLPWNSSIAPL